jgi:hypothetical protein
MGINKSTRTGEKTMTTTTKARQAIESLENLDWEACLYEAEAAFEQARDEALIEMAAREAAEGAAQAETMIDESEIPW